jgi:lipopolysaccharide heptosyltransferase I
MRILIVKLSSIGDVVHALPAAAAVRRAFPSAEITWAVERGAAEMLVGCPAIDRLTVVDTRSFRSVRRVDDALRELRTRYRELRDGGFDVALDLQGLIKSAAIAKLSGAPRRVGFSKSDLREPASRLLLTETAPPTPRTHVIRKNIELAEWALGFESDGIEFPISLSDEERFSAEEQVADVEGGFALLNPAGGWPTKLWPAERFGRLAALLRERTGLTPVIVTGPRESALADEVRRSGGAGALFIKPRLREFFEIARRARVYIGGDTGPTHIAVAAGTPVVGIFGPTEWWRNGSLTEGDICVERNDIGCRVDCHRRSCSNWICLDISPETVLDAVLKRISEN